MNRELRQVLETIGWDTLYEQFIPELGPPNSRGERIARTPFPDVHDTNPSFSVNIHSGLWRCFQTQRGGNYVQFVAIMRATRFDDATGLAQPNFDSTERELSQELGIIGSLDRGWIEQCALGLSQALDLHHRLEQSKPWDFSVARRHLVGYDYESDRLVFPVFDRDGQLVNARMYRPGGRPKFTWRLSGPTITDNYLWPHAGWADEWLVLVEGEPDALTLRSYDIPGVSGTAGGNNPVPPGLWWRRKRIWIWLDNDTVGLEHLPVAVATLLEDAEEVWVVDQTAVGFKDVSEFIVHLRDERHLTPDEIRVELIAVLEGAERVVRPGSDDQEALSVTFAGALDAEHVGHRLEFTARISAKSEQRYYVPTAYTVTCPAQGHAYCGRCPMRTDFNGHAELEHDPRDPLTLKLFMVSDAQQLLAIRDAVGIPPACPDPRGRATAFQAIEPVVLNASIHEAETHEEVTTEERQRREAFVILPEDRRVDENQDYRLGGFALQHPKSQQAVFLLDQLEPLAATHETFTLTPHLQAQLIETYAPAPGAAGVWAKLVDVAEDLASSTTLIRDRLDLHLAYRTVFHSVIRFTIGGVPVDRGWLECLVLGDTRCGKSVAFRKLSQYYQMGLLVDCKLQTPAGILGSVVTSQSTGERYVMAGIYPQQDGRVICFDEFQAPRWAKGGLAEYLSSTRSEGIVRISKAAQAQFHARVRSIWLANPGQGELIEELGQHGCELMRRLITQPEDLARFDFGLTVAKSDVDDDVVNQLQPPTAARYAPELAQSLLLWTYSRRPEQIEFTPEAVTAVQALSRSMYERYDASIPLVEPSDQRTRVAKVALSVAAQCFSTNAEGERLVVRLEHVEVAARLFQLWYDKPSMAYDTYSDRIRRERTVPDEAAVLQVFTSSQYGGVLARQLLDLDEFTERTFGTLVPGQGMLTRGVIQTLHANRVIRLVQRGRRESFQLTPAGTRLLKRYLQNL